jgi:hypothetical protein
LSCPEVRFTRRFLLRVERSRWTRARTCGLSIGPAASLTTGLCASTGGTAALLVLTGLPRKSVSKPLLNTSWPVASALL